MYSIISIGTKFYVRLIFMLFLWNIKNPKMYIISPDVAMALDALDLRRNPPSIVDFKFVQVCDYVIGSMETITYAGLLFFFY